MSRLKYVIRTAMKTVVLGCVLACAALAACSSITAPWDDIATAPASARPTVVVGPFENPSVQSAGMSDVGPGMTEVIRNRLAERSDIVVRSDDALAAALRRVVSASGSSDADQLKSIRKRWPGTRYVVMGAITDFRHIANTPADLSTWTPDRNRVQALASMRITIVDLAAARVIMNDSLEARAWASNAAADQVYRGVSFGSYRFWDLPLGLASRDLIAQCVARINESVAVQREQPIRIVESLSDRRVRLASDAASKCKAGDEYFVCRYDSRGTNLEVVQDRVTGQPLKAKIESRGLYPSAWVMGEPDAKVDLASCVLSRSRP